MKTLEDLKRDLSEIIVAGGVTNTGTVIELLQNRGWPNEAILPAVYQLIKAGTLLPNGRKISYRQN